MAKSPVETSLILIKPDGVRRGLIGEVIKRFELIGLKVIGLKMQKPSLEHIKKHYPTTKKQLEGMGKKTLETYKNYNLNPIKELGTNDTIRENVFQIKKGKKRHDVVMSRPRQCLSWS